MAHILEGVIIFIVGRTLHEWWTSLKAQPKEKRTEAILTCIELLFLGVIFWSDKGMFFASETPSKIAKSAAADLISNFDFPHFLRPSPLFAFRLP